MRIDIAETIAAVKPSVWRFPGGESKISSSHTRLQLTGLNLRLRKQPRGTDGRYSLEMERVSVSRRVFDSLFAPDFSL